MSIILGIDPGYDRVGFGVINHLGVGKLEYINSGIIHTPKELTVGQRLSMIRQDLRMLISDSTPSQMALEALFYFKNAKTVIPVAQARGVILETANFKGLETFEYTPSQIKLNLTGNGKALKQDIQHAVARLLNLSQIISSDDASDALAIAICHTRFLEASRRFSSHKPVNDEDLNDYLDLNSEVNYDILN